MDYLVNIDQLEDASDKASLALSALEKDVSQVERSISILCEQGWEGNSADSFYESVLQWSLQIRSTLYEMEQLVQSLSDYITPNKDLLNQAKAIQM